MVRSCPLTWTGVAGSEHALSDWARLCGWVHGQHPGTRYCAHREKSQNNTNTNSHAQVAFKVREGRQAYVLAVEGSPCLSRTGGSGAAKRQQQQIAMKQHDAAEVCGPLQLGVGVDPAATSAGGGREGNGGSNDNNAGNNKAHVLIVEMAKPGTGGRGDL